MFTFNSTSNLRRWIAKTRRSGKPIALVPTMGALHRGHLSLVRAARRAVGSKGRVVVSIFVNPAQFNQKSDYILYPKTLTRDLTACRRAGVDLVFAPTVLEMYPADFSTWVEEKSLSRPLCGASRPGHFRGVCTVVLKLFNLVQPHFAIFGQKDAQQALVIKRMVRDLNVPVEIQVTPIVRQADGLALSSRNERLNPFELQQARMLNQSLKLVRSAFRKGVRNPAKLLSMARSHLKKVPSIKLDYLELRDASTLQPVGRNKSGQDGLPHRSLQAKAGNLLAIATWVGKTRLIDNITL